jgi:hypothetical protein
MREETTVLYGACCAQEPSSSVFQTEFDPPPVPPRMSGLHKTQPSRAKQRTAQQLVFTADIFREHEPTRQQVA